MPKATSKACSMKEVPVALVAGETDKCVVPELAVPALVLLVLHLKTMPR